MFLVHDTHPHTVELNCQECAGCCIDWHSVVPDREFTDTTFEGYTPYDSRDKFVTVSSDEVRKFIQSGYGDGLIPRLFQPTDNQLGCMTIDGVELASIDSQPVFLMGLRSTRKPVAPFGLDPSWLPTCIFLDPDSLQCRIHNSKVYPDTCARYPADNLYFDAETECERVEQIFGEDRLLEHDDSSPRPTIGPGSVGGTVFLHPKPERLDGLIKPLLEDPAVEPGRIEFSAVAAASAPGVDHIDQERYEQVHSQLSGSTSWISEVADRWKQIYEMGKPTDHAETLDVEVPTGAPPTPGWNEQTNYNNGTKNR